MKHLAPLALIVPLVGCALPAQEPFAPPPVASATVPVVTTLFSAEQLDQLLGPIALYPDALIALILPASTDPSDVVLAARYLQYGGEVNGVDAQPWEESVRALAHYPEVVKWMDQNLAWTRQLGDAFTAQPTEVMNAIQRLRALARAAGTLVDTPQQQVVYRDSVIAIVPTQPDVIYVPYYDPAVVYVRQRTYYGPSAYFGFSSGFAAGWWLSSYGVDWHQRCVWELDRNRHDRERYWQEHRNDWHRHYEPPHGYAAPDVRRWQPHPEFRRPNEFPAHRAPQYPVATNWTVPSNNDRHGDDRWRDNGDRDHRDRRPDATTARPANASAVPPPVVPPVRPPLSHFHPVPAAVPVAPTRPTVPPYQGDHDRSREDRGPRPEYRPHVNPAPVAAPSYVPPPALPQTQAITPQYGNRGMPMPHYEPPHQARPAMPPPQPAPSVSAAPAASSPSQTSQPQSNDDDSHKRPPFIRMR